MDPAAEYVVGVKAWPAYLIVTMLALAAPLYVVMVALLLGADSASWAGYVVVVVVASGVVQFGAMLWVVWRVFLLVRHPPRLTAEGIRMWLLPTATYVLVPWDRVIALRIAVKGLGRGLFVYVHEPEAYADGDPARLRRIRRAMRQFYGTPFVSPLRGGSRRIRDADAAVLHFSQGRHRVTAETRHG
jgi:hypothetical protein